MTRLGDLQDTATRAFREWIESAQDDDTEVEQKIRQIAWDTMPNHPEDLLQLALEYYPLATEERPGTGWPSGLRAISLNLLDRLIYVMSLEWERIREELIFEYLGPDLLATREATR